jgi:hypothetical protein
MNKNMECIKVLLPALIETKEQKQMTKKSRDSIISFEHCVKITEDNVKYKHAIAEAWNKFLDTWRGKEYSYLCITANDVIHDPMCIDYLVKYLQENGNHSVVTAKVIRDKEEFKKGFGQQLYVNKETIDKPKDPATIIFPKGCIEEVGRVDNYYECEFVERDLLYRCKLAGWKWIQPDIILDYHPPYSGTIGNDDDRMHKALARYVSKWGGDADKEQWTHPLNDLNLNYTYTIK